MARCAGLSRYYLSVLLPWLLAIPFLLWGFLRFIVKFDRYCQLQPSWHSLSEEVGNYLLQAASRILNMSFVHEDDVTHRHTPLQKILSQSYPSPQGIHPEKTFLCFATDFKREESIVSFSYFFYTISDTCSLRNINLLNYLVFFYLFNKICKKRQVRFNKIFLAVESYVCAFKFIQIKVKYKNNSIQCKLWDIYKDSERWMLNE